MQVCPRINNQDFQVLTLDRQKNNELPLPSPSFKRQAENELPVKYLYNSEILLLHRASWSSFPIKKVYTHSAKHLADRLILDGVAGLPTCGTAHLLTYDYSHRRQTDADGQAGFKNWVRISVHVFIRIWSDFQAYMHDGRNGCQSVSRVVPWELGRNGVSPVPRWSLSQDTWLGRH